MVKVVEGEKEEKVVRGTTQTAAATALIVVIQDIGLGSALIQDASLGLALGAEIHHTR